MIGKTLPPRPDQPKRFAKRRCHEPGCITLLSSWNPDDRCFLHALPRFRAGETRGNRQDHVKELNDIRPFEEVYQPDIPAAESEWEEIRARWGQRDPMEA